MTRQGRRGKLGRVIAMLALGAGATLALPAIGIGQEDADGGPPATGTVQSFDSEAGLLTIALAQGGEISGHIVRRTQLRCGRWVNLRRHHRRGADATSSRRGRGQGRGRVRGHGRGAPERPQGNRGHSVAGEERGESRGRRGGCDVSDLEEGAVVMKAELLLTHGMAFYKKVGLLPQAAVDDGAEDDGDEEDEEESEDVS